MAKPGQGKGWHNQRKEHSDASKRGWAGRTKRPTSQPPRDVRNQGQAQGQKTHLASNIVLHLDNDSDAYQEKKKYREKYRAQMVAGTYNRDKARTDVANNLIPWAYNDMKKKGQVSESLKQTPLDQDVKNNASIRVVQSIESDLESQGVKTSGPVSSKPSIKVINNPPTTGNWEQADTFSNLEIAEHSGQDWMEIQAKAPDPYYASPPQAYIVKDGQYYVLYLKRAK